MKFNQGLLPNCNSISFTSARYWPFMKIREHDYSICRILWLIFKVGSAYYDCWVVMEEKVSSEVATCYCGYCTVCLIIGAFTLLHLLTKQLSSHSTIETFTNTFWKLFLQFSTLSLVSMIIVTHVIMIVCENICLCVCVCEHRGCICVCKEIPTSKFASTTLRTVVQMKVKFFR